MTSRRRASLREPTGDLAAFPSKTLARATRLYRIVRAGRNPWWFSSSLDGRFDLPAPNGTCYLARDEIAALLELIGPELDGGAVSGSFLDARRVHTLHVPAARRLADVVRRKAVRYGVTAEIGTITPYDKPQAWARALHAAGFEGIGYAIRHDPAPRADGVALFGGRGARTSWPAGRARIIDASLRTKLTAECGIRILEVPRAEQLGFLDL